MREDASERATIYIETTNRALARLKLRTLLLQISKEKVDKIIGVASSYTSDAIHYGATDKPVTSLACVAYAEGLLDALKFLGLIEF